jgi:hypothetical protein
MTVPKAAELSMIPRCTAYKLFKEYNTSDSSVLPGYTLTRSNRGIALWFNLTQLRYITYIQMQQLLKQYRILYL